MRTIITAALAVMLSLALGAHYSAKADSCGSALATAEPTLKRLKDQGTEIHQRRNRTLAVINAFEKKDGTIPKSREQLRQRLVLTVLAMKRLDQAFLAYQENAAGVEEILVGLVEACAR